MMGIKKDLEDRNESVNPVDLALIASLLALVAAAAFCCLAWATNINITSLGLMFR
jgi:hypothetical protein